MLTRLGLAGFLTMCVMMCSIYLYGREIYEPNGSSAITSTQIAEFLRYGSLLLATPVLFLLGVPILQNAWEQWRMRIVTTDALVVIGVASAFVYSYVATLRDSGATYYETACMILVLVTLGRWFEAVGRLHATERVKSLESLIPPEVRVRRDGTVLTIRSEDVRVGDLLIVSAGDRVAADGVIESGRSNFDEQIVTGESTLVVKEAADKVRAGTLNLDGELLVRATSVGDDTTLGQLVKLLEVARASKGRYERLADRAAQFFLPAVIVLAVIAFLGGYHRGGIDEAIMTAMSVLLIACPCGLGIATPMAVWIALGRAAERGALFRSSDALERLARVRTVFFDKTGTLTTGLPRISMTTFDPGFERERAISLAAGIAACSHHAISRSLTDFATCQHVAPSCLESVTTVGGRGLIGSGLVGIVRLGNPAMMEEAGLTFSEPLRHALDAAIYASQSVVCLGCAQKVIAVFAFDEALRPEAPSALDDVRNLGHRVAILTGDHVRRGEAVGTELSVTAHAGLLPSDKVRLIAEASRPNGLVAMIGDGLNDAPAMAAADVGIAMGCGADVTRVAAAICLIGNDLAAVPWLLELSRRTVRTIRTNLFWVFFYNGIGLALAVGGKLSPVIAAIAMVASSLFVVGNSLRLNAWKASPGRNTDRRNLFTRPPVPLARGVSGATA